MALGFDSRECTPELVRVTIHLAAETRSFERAEATMKHVLGRALSAKSIERLVGQVGEELPAWRDSQGGGKEKVVAEVAVVSCDGGRIRTRETGHGPGVHAARWRETKNALFERMAAVETHSGDPCPTLPDTFRQVAHVAKIAGKAAFEVADPPRGDVHYHGPRRILRTCLSSLVCSAEFGPQMRQEADRRGLFLAKLRVFLGDGLAWNWSIRQEHFPDFTPILDFIHAIEHLYAAAQAWESDDTSRWARYLMMVEAVWQGRGDEVIAGLQQELERRGVVPEDSPAEGSPNRVLADTARYLRNNRERMDYPSYRRAGLPITSAPMESLIKQVNHRVKGTEMTWNEPEGAEAILQLRAASLCEDGRLDDYLRSRPGHPYARRSTPVVAA